ncbi:regulatory protein, tetR family [Leifsonia sp. 98AMF]|uniref:TetR/AcrR family transcriptional regulator n=1 Tax=unclassified Leifsonia TaxID=2663824 RepID=UPI00087B241F|nr:MULTISPECIES: TetR/AcrR family transcriptional regulator [unclassified Leifsonia]SDH48851.1 regulatory protein, tetR family [Leifsonia sp. 197AMF]SDI88918.1 regulatory protein, tetR family [Leifsonia sp. 466MF]SDJ91919.1 regulatory protein, tetR family [Leifsonia sp. 157MF]SDN92551.1 regulatory protein, tetR family [Leifsonia sp. 509MF]SEN13302.1 regulatory protein, tetR family [Leifsonia sp. 467MF]
MAGTRPYRSTLRQEHAQQTRRRILEAAAEVFSARGYASASLADIATAAGVSVESVKVHGPKRALLLAAFELSFGGEAGEASLTERPEIAAIAALDDPQEMLDRLVPFIAAANARTAGLWATFTAASRDDEAVRAAYTELLGRRHADYLAMVGLLGERGIASIAALPPAGRRELADALSFVMSPEGHQQLVGESGWSVERYSTWVLATVRTLITEAGAASTG